MKQSTLSQAPRSLPELNRAIPKLETTLNKLPSLLNVHYAAEERQLPYRITSVLGPISKVVPQPTFQKIYIEGQRLRPENAHDWLVKTVPKLKDIIETEHTLLIEARNAYWSSDRVDQERFGHEQKTLLDLLQQLEHLARDAREQKNTYKMEQQLRDWDKRAYPLAVELGFASDLDVAMSRQSWNSNISAWLDATVDVGISNRHNCLESRLETIRDYPETYCAHKPAVGPAEDIEPSAHAKSALELVLILCRRFHTATQPLKERGQNRQSYEIEKEYDVQDLLEGLLRLHFANVERESGSPTHLGKAPEIDFILPEYKVAIEVKKTSKGHGLSPVSDELAADSIRYGEHPNVSILVCFVYDPEERIKNARVAENQLDKLSTDTLKVISVIVHPGSPVAPAWY